MNNKLTFVFLVYMLLPTGSISSQIRFAERLCGTADYFCMHVKKGESWEKLFFSSEERDLVKRINRMNIRLRPGMVIAIPKNIERLSIYDLSPFPRYIDPIGEKLIVISQKELAWGAYNAEGSLLWWGPISSGMGKCKAGDCNTPTGSFRIIRKQDSDCVSTIFPSTGTDEQGGASMPYCMHFLRGYALHGSTEVPGYKASHGCVRMFIEDARWLNEEFIDLPGGGMKGTRVMLDAP